MLPSYVKMALRVIRKQKQFSVINTLGLSIGLACCLLIFLYIIQQLQYDQFHPDADKLFRITYEVSNKDSENHYAVSVPGFIPTLQETYPEIEQAARISAGEEKVVEINGRLFNEQNNTDFIICSNNIKRLRIRKINTEKKTNASIICPVTPGIFRSLWLYTRKIFTYFRNATNRS